MYYIKSPNTFITLCLINMAHSVLILKVKDVDQLLSIVNKLNNDNRTDYSKARLLIDDHYRYENVYKDYLKGIRATLVKRIVPHGYKTPDLEYDRKNKTYYRPLLKLHKTGVDNYKLFDDQSQILKNTLDKFVRSIINKVDVLPPGMIPLEQLVKHKRFYSLSEETVDRLRNNKLRTKILLWLVPKDELRTSAFQKSGEQNDPYAPNLPPNMQEESSEEKDSFPKYNFWDYWTYEKSIHQDKCKGRLIEWNGICIETPPH